MKKMLLLLVLSTSFLLVSCEAAISELDALDGTNPLTASDRETSTEGQEVLNRELSDEVIKEALNELMYMQSYETTLHYRMVTEEMSLEVNPLLKYQVYTNEDGKIMRLAYNSKIIEGLGMQAFEIIIDESTESFYINDTETWHQSTFTDLETELGFGETITLPDTDIEASLEEINTLLIQSAQNFNKATYVEMVNDGDRNLAHVVLEYNVRTILSDLYDVYRENNAASTPDFDAIISMLDLEKLAVLFETFEIDVYFDTNTLQVARLELEIADLLKDIYTIMQEEINSSIDDDSIDVGTMLDYLEHLEIGVNIYNVNSLDEIVIPQDAKQSERIDFQSWFIDPTEAYDKTFTYDSETYASIIIPEDKTIDEGTDSVSGASVTTDDQSTTTDQTYTDDQDSESGATTGTEDSESTTTTY